MGPNDQKEIISNVPNKPTQKTITGETKKLVGAFALSVAGLMPQAQAVEAPKTPSAEQAIKSILAPGENLSETLAVLDKTPDLKTIIVGIAQSYEDFRIKNPGYKNFTVNIETLTPDESNNRDKVLSFIENDLSLAPKKTIEQILGEPYKKLDIVNDPERYNRYVDALFDNSEIKVWYRVGEGKREATPDELAEVKRIRDGTRDRFKTIVERWAKGAREGYLNDIKTIEDFQNLFDDFVKNIKPENTSTEAIRLGLSSVSGIAFHRNLIVDNQADTKKVGQRLKDRQWVDLGTNISWLRSLMGSHDGQVKVTLQSIGGTTEKVTIPGAFKTGEFSGMFNGYENIHQFITPKLNTDFRKNLDLADKVNEAEKTKSEAEKAKAEAEEAKAEAEEAKAEAEKSKLRNEKLEKDFKGAKELYIEADKIGDEIRIYLNMILSNPNDQKVRNANIELIQTRIKRIVEIKNQLEKLKINVENIELKGYINSSIERVNIALSDVKQLKINS